VKLFEKQKAELIARVQRLQNRKHTSGISSLLNEWCDVYDEQPFCKLQTSFDPRQFYDYYTDDELVFCGEFDFWDSKYLRECCSPGSDCLAGKRCFPIGGAYNADKFVYICNDLSLGIAIVHHDDAFCAEDLDDEVETVASNTDVKLARFVDSLIPRTEKTILGVDRDGRYWMILEKRDKTVRCQMNMKESWEEEQSFETHEAAREYYLQLIRECRKKNNKLTIVSCPHNLTSVISSLIDPV